MTKQESADPTDGMQSKAFSRPVRGKAQRIGCSGSRNPSAVEPFLKPGSIEFKESIRASTDGKSGLNRNDNKQSIIEGKIWKALSRRAEPDAPTPEELKQTELEAEDNKRESRDTRKKKQNLLKTGKGTAEEIEKA